jgi:3-methyladenine DNA glycosylase/8-oxoguanine DNA glycosylase
MSEVDRPTGYEQITDHADAGVKLLARQFRGKPLIEALLRSWLDQVQEAEDAFWALLVNTTLETAVGDALDQIGALLGKLRGTLDDDAYRAVLRAIVRARMSSGTAADIQAVVVLLLDAITYTYTEGYGSVLIEPHEPLPFAGAAAIDVLRLTKAGGVQLQLIDPPDAETDLFTCSADPFRATTDAARGFSDTTQAAGGQLTGVLA